MIYPIQQALNAFLVIFSFLPSPFVNYIVWTVVVTILLRLLLVVISQ